MVVKITERELKTRIGDCREIIYYDGISETLVLVLGEVFEGEEVLCRVHSACVSAHMFYSLECDCREQLKISQQMIKEEGRGIIILLDQEGRGNGHIALMEASNLAKKEKISQTEAYKRLGFEKDGRNYFRAAEIVQDLKITSVKLLTNNPKKIEDLESSGVTVVGKKGIIVDTKDNLLLSEYLKEKRDHLGHDI